jgi:hypothetical protein
MMDFGISLGIGGYAVLAIGAVVIGLATYLIGEVENPYQWIVTGVAAFIGGFVASEWIVGFRTFEPVWDGLALLPALGGGVVVGGIVDFGMRLLFGGTTTNRRLTA